MTDEIKVTVTQTLTELQLTKDSSVQAIPLSNEAYEKALKDGEDTMHHIPHLTNINIKDNTEEPMKFIKRIAEERADDER